MSDIEVVNPVPVEEAKPWLSAMSTTFLGDPTAPEFEHRVEMWRREWCAERTWGARAGGRWVATLATDERTLTVPGPDGATRDLTADALTGVTVSATHRRRGLLSRMLTASLAAARKRGDAVSILIAAEWPIYGRFGYAPATQSASYTLLSRSRERLLDAAPSGSVRQVDPSELDKVAADVFDRARRLRPGQVDRRGDWWPRRLGLDGYRPKHEGNAPSHYLHEGPEGPDGVLSWASTRDFKLNGEHGAITVGDLTAATELAYRNLFAYLIGIDVVGEILLEDRPVDEPIRWLLSDGRALRHTGTLDDLWIRLLDIPAALSARSYSLPGRVVLEVVDEHGGRYGAGRFLLEADGPDAECLPTTAPAEVRIQQRTLASIYLGAVTLPQLAITKTAEELRPGGLARLGAMFAVAVPPWNATGF